MAPLDRKIDHDQARAYAKRMAQRPAAAADPHPLSLGPGERAGHIFIDYLRNGRGTAAIGAWSPRRGWDFRSWLRLSWRQLERGIRPNAFTIEKPPAQITRQVTAHGGVGLHT